MAFIHFLKPKNQLEEGGRTGAAIQQDPGEPEKTCPTCHKEIPLSTLWANQMVCSCGYHFRMNARQRLGQIADRDSFQELWHDLHAENPLDFPGYGNKADNVRTLTGEQDAVICGIGTIGGVICGIFVMNPDFMMGSMGSAVGEKITRLFEHAAEKRLPVVGFTVSGGARMQEGLLSLMQMAKTSAAVKRHSEAGLLYLAVLTDPTTGGVTASFAMEADITLAEPGATVGFAGARVVEPTTKKALPKGFQKSEFVLEHGFIDKIVPRRQLKDQISKILQMHSSGVKTC